MSSKDIELSMKLAALAAALDDLLQEEYGERMGFALIVAPLGRPSETLVQYASNIQSTDAQGMIRTLLKRWEQKLPDVPLHSRH